MTDREAFAGGVRPGFEAADAPVELDGKAAWLSHCFGASSTGLYFANPDGTIAIADSNVLTALAEDRHKILVVLPPYCPFAGEAAKGRILDQAGLAHERYDARPGTFYLVGPDRRVIGRWRSLDPAAIRAASKGHR